MKILITIFFLILLTAKQSFSITTELEANLKNYMELIEKAQDHHLKSILKFDANRLIYKAEFDSLGNLKSIKDYHFKRKNDFELITFKCENGLILEYEEYVSFLKKSRSKFNFEYDSLNRPIKLISSFILNGSLYKDPDTISINYRKNGQFAFKTYRNGQDTIRYYYDENDSLKGCLHQRDTTAKTDQRVYSENGCFVGYYHGDDTRSLAIRDENCNLLGWKDDWLYHEQWVTCWRADVEFRDNTIIKQTIYSNYKFNKKDPAKIDLKFDEILTYDYDQNGLLLTIKYWTEKGKMKRSVRIQYDYYVKTEVYKK